MKKYILLTMIAIATTACLSKDEQQRINSKQAILKTLKLAAESGEILYGHQDATLYGHRWFGERGRSDVQEVCGDYPAIIGFDLGGIELAEAESLDHVPFSMIRQAAIDHYERGGIVTVSWHVNNPVTGGDSWDVSCPDVVAAILEGGSHANLFDLWLERLADYMLSFKATDGTQIPLIFRPWHEHTGNWFWWGQSHCTTDQYIALWEMTKAKMEAKGITELVYTYSPNLGVDLAGYMERYPGHELIDLLGIDIYHFVQKNDTKEVVSTNEEQYIAETKRVFQFLAQIGQANDKPIAFTETGLEGLCMPNWWTEVLQVAIAEAPVSYVLTWRNAYDNPEHYYGPFVGQQSEADFLDFYRQKNTLFLRDLHK